MTIRCAGGIVVEPFTDSTRILQNGFLLLELIQGVNSFYKKCITELSIEKIYV